MALSPPVPREALHRRTIEMVGYRREDGLLDIEARLVDTKTYSFDNHDRGEIHPGTPLHGMLARMTVDENMVIVQFEAVTEFAPYSVCPQAAPNFGRLAGLRIGPGFVRAANERIGGVQGCTHFREMLGQMGTVAYQTAYSKREAVVAVPGTVPRRPAVLNTCLAYASDGPVVKRQYPGFYTGG